jgi:hypothetical protein
MRIDYVKMDTVFNNASDREKFQFLLAFTSTLHLEGVNRDDIIKVAAHQLNEFGINASEFIFSE